MNRSFLFSSGCNYSRHQDTSLAVQENTNLKLFLLCHEHAGNLCLFVIIAQLDSVSVCDTMSEGGRNEHEHTVKKGSGLILTCVQLHS